MPDQVHTHLLFVTWEGAAYLNSCLDSVLSQSALPHSVLVVDNASRDNSNQIVGEFAQRAKAIGICVEQIRLRQNIGFTRGANVGLRAVLENSSVADDDLIVLLNQDTVLEREFLSNLARSPLEISNLGAVGGKIYYPDGVTLQHAGGYLEHPRLLGKHYGHHCADGAEFDKPREVEFVTGAAIGFRAAALREVGLFDEIFSPGYYEDVELCARLRRHGWSVWYWPSARLKHAESASFDDWWDRLTLSHRNRLLFGLLYAHSEPETFLQAELSFLRTQADVTDCRVLASASARLLAMLTSVQAENLHDLRRVADAAVALYGTSINRLSEHYHNLGQGQ